MLPARFVHFFGPDGSGKSTQVNLLVDYYLNRGIKVRKFWLRSPHTFAYLLWKFLVLIGFYRCIVNAFGVQVKIPAVQRSNFLKEFWSIVEFLSVLPLIARAKLYLLRGYALIAERYVFDTITTIAFFLDDSAFSRGMLSRMLLRFIPSETAFIFLDADFVTICKRRAKFYSMPRSTKGRFFRNSEPPSPNLEPYSFIDFQRKLYAAFARSYCALVIDTSNSSVEETFSRIQNYLSISN